MPTEKEAQEWFRRFLIKHYIILYGSLITITGLTILGIYLLEK